jgi:uncharacterized protein (DUF58 family)
MKPKTVVLLAVAVAVALFIGVPVPKKQPYISLSIKTNEDTYSVGDEVQIKYCIVNRMPFSVRLEPIMYLETSFYTDEDGARSVSNRTEESRGDEIYLTPFQVYDRDEMVTFIVSRETDYILYMKLETMEITKTIKVKPRGGSS